LFESIERDQKLRGSLDREWYKFNSYIHSIIQRDWTMNVWLGVR
jgi:hypothetical protein